MPFPAPWLLRTVGRRSRPLPPATFSREILREGVLTGRTVAGARLENRSEARGVPDDVSASPLADSSVFSRSHAHLRYFEIPLPSSVPVSGFRRHSSGSRGFAFSFAAPLRLVLVEEHVSLVGVQCQLQKVAPQEQSWRYKTVQLLQTSLSLSEDQVETDGTG